MVKLAVPLVSQLDGDTNQLYDCVPASLAAALEYLTGTKFTASEMKDTVYGKEYKGVTDPLLYIPYCLTHQVKMTRITGNNTELLAETFASVKNMFPVLLTEDDPYAKGFTHVIVACGADEPPGTLTVMDPYVGKYITEPAQHWITVLRSGAVFVMEHIQYTPVGWKDTGTHLIAPNGVAVSDAHGFRTWILQKKEWDNTDWPIEEEVYQNPLEISNLTLGEGYQQLFNMTTLGWTKKHGPFKEYTGPEIKALRKKAGEG